MLVLSLWCCYVIAMFFLAYIYITYIPSLTLLSHLAYHLSIPSDLHFGTDRQAQLESKHPAVWRAYQQEMQFMNDYMNRTNIEYRGFYGPLLPKLHSAESHNQSHSSGKPVQAELQFGPRAPPILPIRTVQRTGDVLNITSYGRTGYWYCEGVSSDCQDPSPPVLQLHNVLQPPAGPGLFIIPNLVSKFEVQSLLRLSRGRMAASSVGDGSTGVRTSRVRNSDTAWLARHTNAITDTLFKRAGDILGVHESVLNEQASAESLQVVHYAIGQKYDTHADWTITETPHQRFATLLIYLTDQPDLLSGGETAFPLAHIKVHPKQGMGVLFYNMLPDGNSDNKALHAALPVLRGEKSLANFWVWDPVRINAFGTAAMGQRNGWGGLSALKSPLEAFAKATGAAGRSSTEAAGVDHHN